MTKNQTTPMMRTHGISETRMVLTKVPLFSTFTLVAPSAPLSSAHLQTSQGCDPVGASVRNISTLLMPDAVTALRNLPLRISPSRVMTSTFLFMNCCFSSLMSTLTFPRPLLLKKMNSITAKTMKRIQPKRPRPSLRPPPLGPAPGVVGRPFLRGVRSGRCSAIGTVPEETFSQSSPLTD